MAARIELLLPVGGRPRQLAVRTLLIGMLAVIDDHRPAHLTRVHQALIALPGVERRRLGVDVDWRHGPHTLTYRQVERTFGLVVAALTKHEPDGAPSETLTGTVDDLLEATIPAAVAANTSALAVDWTDHDTWALAPHSDGVTADPEASWGHRRSHAIGVTDEMFYGYYLQAATMVTEEHGPPVPELVRRILVTSCHHDPPPAFVAVLQRLAASGVALGDVLADSGYSHRVATHWALPLRQLGARLVHDLHPHDRGPQGTHGGAIIANGRLYCPATPHTLLTIGPLARGATTDAATAHDTQTAEAARYKLTRLSADDADGYHRVACPALTAKIRCPLRPDSMRHSHDRPEILTPPPTPPRCCTQHTVTIPVEINAKTAQKHDYPSAAWRRSYTRRSGAERTNATIKDPATTDIRRGWCRLSGLTAITLFLACALAVRNQRVLASFHATQADNQRRAAAGQPPRTRQRRRRTLTDLVANSPP